MGRDNRILFFPQGTLRRQRFLLKHIQYGRTLPTFESLPVHKGAAGDVDQNTFNQAQSFLIDQSPGLVRQGKGQYDDISGWQFLVQGFRQPDLVINPFAVLAVSLVTVPITVPVGVFLIVPSPDSDAIHVLAQ